MSDCGLYVCHKTCVRVCSCKIDKRKTLLQITNPTTVCTSGVLASNGGNLVLRPNKMLLKANFLSYQPQIWNTTCLDLWL